MIVRFPPAIYPLLLASAQLVACNTPPRGAGVQRDAPAVISPASEQRAQAFADEGKRLKEEGFTDQALESFNQAIEENPKLTQAYLGIGDIYREEAAYDKANLAYRRAVVSDPNNFDARYFLGLSNHLQGKLKAAISSYQRALRIDPDSYLANREMGSAYLQSGQAKQAIPFAERAVELNPDSQAGWANLAAAYSLTKQYDKAVAAYRETLELGEPEIQVYLGLADAHIKLGNFPRAENVLRAIEARGGNAIARERMGLVLFKLRKFEESAQSYSKALEDSPDDTAALNGLGVSLMAQYLRDGEEDEQKRLEALRLWRQSLQIRPDQGVLIDLISRYSKE